MKTLDEDRIAGVWLQIDSYNEFDNCHVKHFEVPKWWLQNRLRKNIEQ